MYYVLKYRGVIHIVQNKPYVGDYIKCDSLSMALDRAADALRLL